MTTRKMHTKILSDKLYSDVERVTASKQKLLAGSAILLMDIAASLRVLVDIEEAREQEAEFSE